MITIFPLEIDKYIDDCWNNYVSAEFNFLLQVIVYWFLKERTERAAHDASGAVTEQEWHVQR